MEKIIKRAKSIIMEGNIERVSESIWNVGDEIVKKVKRPGRLTFSCTCDNHTMFCNDNPICNHKLAVILFESDNCFHVRVNQMIREYEKSKELGIDNVPEAMIEDLKTLKYIK